MLDPYTEDSIAVYGPSAGPGREVLEACRSPPRAQKHVWRLLCRMDTIRSTYAVLEKVLI